MSLKVADILQIDAIIITGILILLTISADQFNNPNFQIGKGVSLLAWLIILPFAISAIYALKIELSVADDDDLIDEQKQKKRFVRSIISMIAGFVYLLIFIGLYTASMFTSK